MAVQIFRSDLQQLALARLREAEILLQAKEYAGAYHLAGYAVELALKAKIAKNSKRYAFPDKDLVKEVFSHVPGTLVRLAGLHSELQLASSANAAFKANWDVVSKWNSESRYRPAIAASEARDMLTCISDPNNGILQWIQKFW